MEWIIWILVIIAVIAIVVWMLRRNSGTNAGGNTPEQRHPGNQPGSGANEPIVEAGPPVSNTPAAGTAGSGASGSVTERGAGDDTNAVSGDDERWRDGGTDITDRPTAADRGTEHTTTAGPVAGSRDQQRHDDGGTPPPPGQETDHNALGRHNVGEGEPDDGGHHSLGSHNQGEPNSELGHHSLGSHNQGEPHSERGHHSLGSHNLGDSDVDDEDRAADDSPHGRHRNDGESDTGGKGTGRQ